MLTASSRSSITSPAFSVQIGRAHVCTPVTNAPLVWRLLLEQKKYVYHLLMLLHILPKNVITTSLRTIMINHLYKSKLLTIQNLFLYISCELITLHLCTVYHDRTNGC